MQQQSGLIRAECQVKNSILWIQRIHSGKLLCQQRKRGILSFRCTVKRQAVNSESFRNLADIHQIFQLCMSVKSEIAGIVRHSADRVEIKPIALRTAGATAHPSTVRALSHADFHGFLRQHRNLKKFLKGTVQLRFIRIDAFRQKDILRHHTGIDREFQTKLQWIRLIIILQMDHPAVFASRRCIIKQLLICKRKSLFSF